jgi:hypothetical protein
MEIACVLLRNTWRFHPTWRLRRSERWNRARYPLCCTGMEPDPDPKLADGPPRLGGKAFLGIQGAGYRLAALKGSRHPVAGVLGDAASGRPYRLAEEGIVAGNDGAHLGGVFLPQPCRTFDVGEEEDQHLDTPF